MKIAEVRNAIKDYKKEDLQYIITELYKIVGKQKLQEKNVDEMILHVTEIRTAPKEKKKAVKEIQPIDELVAEVNELISDAKNGFYLKPNNIIPKKERPKFRFKVKAYYKALLANYKEGEDALKAAYALCDLYELLCYGCVDYITNSNDQFQSAGIEQPVFFDHVLWKCFSASKDEKMMEKVLMLVSEAGLSNVNLHDEMEYILLQYLDTSSMQLTAIQKAKELYEKYKKDGVGKKSSWYLPGMNSERSNIMNDMILCIHFSREEYEEGISFYKDHYLNFYDNDREVMYYYLYEWLERFDLKEYWIQEYENAVKEGIEPRNRTSEKYRYLKEKGEFKNQEFCGEWL